MRTPKSILVLAFVFVTALAFNGKLIHHRFAQEALHREGRPLLRTTPKARPMKAYGRLPLSFEINKGQTNPHVKFLSRGRGYTLFLTSDAAVLSLVKTSAKQSLMPRFTNGSAVPIAVGDYHRPGGLLPNPLADLFASNSQVPKTAQQRSALTQTSIVQLRLAGENPNPRVVGQDKLPGISNYFIGNNPSKWLTHVPTYARVKYEHVYPGIDLVYYGNQGHLEYDFVVNPGAKPNEIHLAVEAASSSLDDDQAPRVRIARNGDLVIPTGDGIVRFGKPAVYQQMPHGQHAITGNRAYLHGNYTIDENGEVNFVVPHYNHRRPLVIDPVLSYSTYLGGSEQDQAYSIAVDSAGDAFITGSTASTDFPTHAPYQPANGGDTDAFVAELNPTGSALIFSTYVGGNGNDDGTGIAAGNSGSVYVAGVTGSGDFPVTAGAFETTDPVTMSGQPANFVLKVGTGGSTLGYSTYLSDEYGAGILDGVVGQGTVNAAIAVDSAGDAYVAVNGYTFKVAKLNPSGSAIVYQQNYTGDTQAIAVDSSGDAYVTGYDLQYAKGFPLVNALQGNYGGGPTDAFVVEFNATGGIVYSTFLGGKNADTGTDIAVDSSGEAYVTGVTASPDFPITSGAFKTTCGTDGNCNYNGSAYLTDAFIAKVNSTGNALVYSTFLGGSGNDSANAITVGADGSAYLTGTTSSTDFPTANPTYASIGGGQDAFASALNPSGSGLLFSTFLGGSGSDDGLGIALDPTGGVYVAGATASTNFPVTQGVYQTACGSPASPCISTGLDDAFVAKFTGVSLTASLTPSSLTFPSQGLGTTSSAQTATLTDNSSAAISITSISITGTDSSDFGETDNCGSSLAAGGNCAINVTFAPTAAGTRTATLSVADSAPGSPQTASLLGTGAQPNASLSPTSLSFGGEPLSMTSKAQTVTLSNSSSSDLTITSVSISAGFAETNNCGSSVAAGSNCTINVTFDPTASGAVNGTLTVADNASGNPQTVSLSGTGEDFTLGANPTSATVTAGKSTTATLSVTPVDGFNMPVALSCSGAPSQATCTISPSSVTPSGSSGSTATLKLTTTAASLVAPIQGDPPQPWLGHLVLWWLLALAGAGFAASCGRKRRWARLSGLGTVVLAAALMAGCGSGGSSAPASQAQSTGTPSGTYTLTVTGAATSGSSTLSHKATISVKVNP